MNHEFRSSIIMMCIALLGITTSAWAVVYVVKEKDSLSIIAKKHFNGPVWGENGSLKKIISQNPEIKNPDFIFPSEKINLNDISLEQNSSEALPEIKNNLEIKPELGRTVSSENGLKPDESGTLAELTPFTSMISLTSKDPNTGARSTVASSLYVGADARYIQIWSENFKTYLRGKISYVSFEPPADTSKSISEKSKILTTFGLGGIKKLSSRLTLGVYADLEKNLFLRSVSTTSVTVDSVLVPSVLPVPNHS